MRSDTMALLLGCLILLVVLVDSGGAGAFLIVALTVLTPVMVVIIWSELTRRVERAAHLRRMRSQQRGD